MADGGIVVDPCHVIFRQDGDIRLPRTFQDGMRVDKFNVIG